MVRSAYLLIALCVMRALPAFAQSPTLQQNMVRAAEALIQSFDATQRSETMKSFDDPDRLRWSNEPVYMHVRKGLQMGEISKEQKILVHHLLQTVFSEQGYLKALNIIRLDDWLKKYYYNKDTVAKYYGSSEYWLTLFGTPGDGQRWGWRFEGHHLSLSVTASPRGISVTPFFVGTQPSVIPDGPEAGTENMFEETNQAWNLLASMTPQQRSLAVTSDKQPKESDILTRTGQEAYLKETAGIPVSSLSAAQQKIVRALIQSYVGNLTPELATRYMQKVVDKAWPHLYFIWMGSTARGKPAYYRLQATDGLVIEYCSRFHDIHHIHSVWRIVPEDFGKTL